MGRVGEKEIKLKAREISDLKKLAARAAVCFRESELYLESPKGPKMGQNGPKWAKPAGPKWTKSDPNGPRLAPKWVILDPMEQP